MSLLDRIFKKLTGSKNQEPEKGQEKKVLLMDILFDWFKDSGIEIAQFKNDFFTPCIEVIKLDPSSNKYLMDYPEQAMDNYFYQHSILYLSAKNPSNKYFKYLLDYLLNKDNGTYSIVDSIRSIPNERLFLTNKSLWDTLRTGQLILRSYHAIYDQRDSNLSYLGQLSSELGVLKDDPDSSIFDATLAYLSAQNFEGLSATLTNALAVSTRAGIETNAASLDKLKKAISESLNKFNSEEAAKIAASIAYDYNETILKIKHAPIIEATEYKKRKYLKLNKFPATMAFLEQYKEQRFEVLKYHIYLLGNSYIPREFTKIQKEIAVFLTKDLLLSPVSFDSLLDIKITQSVGFLCNEIYRPLFENLQSTLKVGDPLFKKFEAFVLEHVVKYHNCLAFENILQLIGEKYNELEDKLERSVYGNKYSGLYTLSNFQYNWHLLQLADKKDAERKINLLVQKLSLLFPIALKGIAKFAYYAVEGQKLLTVNIDGENKDFSTQFVQEINVILQAKKIGYRLIPIPFQSKKQNKQFNHLTSIAIFNWQQFDFFKNTYLDRHFPALISCHFIQQIHYENLEAPLLLENNPDTEESASGQNAFLASPSWKWFKDDYIDQLSSKENWYEIMEVIMACKGAKKPNKKWLEELDSRINSIGKEAYYKELGAMLTPSLKEEFWFIEVYRVAIKGIIWSCSFHPSDASFSILKSIIESAYKKIPGIGPRSAAVGNIGLEALISSGDNRAFGILHILRNSSKYARFIKAIDKYLEKFQEFSDEDPEILADKSIPKFDFINGKKQVAINTQLSVNYFFKKQSLSKQWVLNGKTLTKAPDILKTSLKSEEREIAAEFKRINGIYKGLKARVKTYWLHDRKWTYADWQTYILAHPLVNPWIQNLVWENETAKHSFIVQGEDLLNRVGQSVANDPEDIISLWHPITAEPNDLAQWQQYIVQHKITQTLRQVYREHYPFSEKELGLSTTERFSHHFLVTRKLMAIANSAAWIFTYVHEDSSWPRKYIKSLNLTVHLKCDYNNRDYAIPTKELLITKENTLKIGYNVTLNAIPFSEVPAKTLSEICRDVDLFIATTSIANDPELSSGTEAQKFYRQDFNKGLFSDNASAKIRKAILQQVGTALGLEDFTFEKNYLIIKGSLNTYRINLGSGFAQIEGRQQHINLLPNIAPMKKNKKISIPIQDDETLYIILAKALFLQNDHQITDEKIKTLLVN